MLEKLYQKSEINFALFWIGLYVILMNIAMQICGGFDNLEGKTVGQMLVPVGCIIVLAVAVTAWIVKNGLSEKYGFCSFKGNAKTFLWFIPLILVSCTNLKNGLEPRTPLMISTLMAINISIAGYVEEVIFRGFLFRAMEKDNIKTAIIVSAVTFGAGHIVNLGNTADTLGVILQVCYAIAIGFMFTLIVFKGKSIWPCIISHIFVNGTSVYASKQGPFTNLMYTIFNQVTPELVEISSAILIIVISGGYALWLWKKHE